MCHMLVKDHEPDMLCSKLSILLHQSFLLIIFDHERRNTECTLKILFRHLYLKFTIFILRIVELITCRLRRTSLKFTITRERNVCSSHLSRETYESTGRKFLNLKLQIDYKVTGHEFRED
ncbi:hypothetical protein RIR_jg29108.t1 [Rhizophagus irregularis DAOM 181602=DAOM 197198]|uniref:Uncharacterized protein n=1 Tax=Rhizophagus irregularis (strain DAOM 181602 / DAOM 197198 / MUCL 43194) TaxID=747089 RepID=U9SPK9_RHIID|nr:hypothetical protein RIR_jg29108.t1 [Rhizophagus irregularis DAOM 181602=DAOM 197198]